MRTMARDLVSPLVSVFICSEVLFCVHTLRVGVSDADMQNAFGGSPDPKQNGSPRVEKGTKAISGDDWNAAVKTLREGLTTTEDALDLIGMGQAKEHVDQVATILAFFESKDALLGNGISDENDSDAWQTEVAEHHEGFVEALSNLQDLLKENKQKKPHTAEGAAKFVAVFKQKLLTDPLDEVQKQVEAFTDAASTLLKLRNMCSGGNGDISEDIYARIWRLSESVLKKGVTRRTFKALKQSAYEAVVEVHADAAEKTLVHTVCPAAAQAARDLLLGERIKSAKEDGGEHEEDDKRERVAFLLSVLNSPTVPEACGLIYRERDAEADTGETCMCDDGQCISNPVVHLDSHLDGEADGVAEKVCEKCGGPRCQLFWQQAQCREPVNTGCYEDSAPDKVVLGSKRATQVLIRRGLYLDPSCRGALDCLKRRLGAERFRRWYGYGKTILAVRRDWLAAAALASVGSALLKLGNSSSLLEENVDNTHGDSVAAVMPDLAESAATVVSLVKPALLSYLWIRFRVEAVKERAAVHGFCRRAARELSLIAQPKDEEQDRKPDPQVDEGKRDQAQDTGALKSSMEEEHAEELSEVLEDAVKQSAGHEGAPNGRDVQAVPIGGVFKPMFMGSMMRMQYGNGLYLGSGVGSFRPYRSTFGLLKPQPWLHPYPLSMQPLIKTPPAYTRPAYLRLDPTHPLFKIPPATPVDSKSGIEEID